MGHRSGNRSVGDTEHRLLKTDANLNVHIDLTTAVIVVPAAEFLRQMPEHIFHAETGGNPSSHAGNRIGIESAVLEITDVW